MSPEKQKFHVQSHLLATLNNDFVKNAVLPINDVSFCLDEPKNVLPELYLTIKKLNSIKISQDSLFIEIILRILANISRNASNIKFDGLEIKIKNSCTQNGFDPDFFLNKKNWTVFRDKFPEVYAENIIDISLYCQKIADNGGRLTYPQLLVFCKSIYECLLTNFDRISGIRP